MKTKVSIIFLVFESYEMTRRQVLYMNSLYLPDEVEVIFADDGSNPPVILYDKPNFRHKIVYREKKSLWTIPKIINYAVSFAEGVYLFFLGVDHILSPELVDYFSHSTAGYSVFRRKYALIDRQGRLLKIQYKGKREFEDCECDYTSLGWIKTNHFRKIGKMQEDLSGPIKGSADLNLFKKWCRLRDTSRAAVIDKGLRNNPTYYMLPEKKSVKLLKGRIGEHWNLMSHLRPVNYLHHLPERDERARVAYEKPLEISAEEARRFRFVHLDGTVSKKGFHDFIGWRHPAEVRWMLGEFK